MRPTKLTSEVQARICNAIAAGNHYMAAVKYARVGYSTFRTWMIKGKKAKKGKYLEFREAVEKAEADAEVTIVAQWRQHIPENWQAAKEFLARRFPQRWSPNISEWKELTEALKGNLRGRTGDGEAGGQENRTPKPSKGRGKKSPPDTD